MSGKTKRLMVMAGGTGGMSSGLAVAHHLMAQGWQVRWLGTADRMEASLVPQHGIEIDFIQISGLRGKGLMAQLTAPVRIYRAVRQAKKIMRDYQPDVVLGMGGYVSGPGGLAAWLCGVLVVLHEQNGIAGLTNRWLARIAKKVLQAFRVHSPMPMWWVIRFAPTCWRCHYRLSVWRAVKGRFAYWLSVAVRAHGY